MAENIINKVLKDERPFYQQAFENSIDALPDDLSTGHGKAMYTPNGIVDRAQSVGDYHKMANADFSNRISNKIGENYGNLAQAGYNLFSPALSIPASFGYDYSQAKDRMEPDSGIMGLGKAFMDESPFSAAYQRAVGVADPFFQQFGMTTVPENALKNNLRPANINFTNLLQQDVNKDIYNGYKSEQPADAISRTNVQGMDYEMDPAAQEGFLNPDIQPSQNMFQRAGNAIQSGLGSMRDFAGKGMDLGKMAMSGIGNAIMPGIGFLMSNLKPEPLFRETLSNSRKENNTLQGLGLDGVGNFGGFTTDDLGRVVNTGNYITPENIMAGYNAGFDLAGSALDRIGTIQRAIDKGRFKDKFALDRANKKIDALKTAAVASAQAKRQAYQDQIDRAKNEAAANRARAKSITAGYGGHDDSPGATGPTAAGAGMGAGGGYQTDYGFIKDGGIAQDAPKGLASMFVRRG